MGDQYRGGWSAAAPTAFRYPWSMLRVLHDASQRRVDPSSYSHGGAATSLAVVLCGCPRPAAASTSKVTRILLIYVAALRESTLRAHKGIRPSTSEVRVRTSRQSAMP